MPKQKPIFGVISASTADAQQREYLHGIITEAQARQIDIVVLSNIYNPIDSTVILDAENQIYNLIAASVFDGFILLSESLTNIDLRRRICALLATRTDVPVIAVGTPVPELQTDRFRYINNDEVADFAAITSHLIAEHNLTEIDIITGPPHLAASSWRVAGYRQAMEAHGLCYDKNKVIDGDFWTTSGQALAMQYLSGERPYPQALICACDYMAYGLLDAFMARDVDPTAHMMLIGYESVGERSDHTPWLTTYRRNRHDLGVAAVRILAEGDAAYQAFTPPAGQFVFGKTCACGECSSDTRQELEVVQMRRTYDFLNLFCQFEHRITEAHTIEEFVQTCRSFQFMIRGRGSLYLCLYSNWYEQGFRTDDMIAYNLIWDQPPMVFHKEQLSTFQWDAPMALYVCPLFFSDRALGYVVLGFDHPDAFDPIFRNWLKSLSNGLEFLRMKNDIRYLSECQNLSEHRDTLTGMYNEAGIRQVLRTTEREHLYLVMLKTGLFGEDLQARSGQADVEAILDVAEAVQAFCGTAQPCARIAQNTFVCLVRTHNSPEFLEDLLTAHLYRHKHYMDTYGLGSFLCTAQPCGQLRYSALSEQCQAAFEQQMQTISAHRCHRDYAELRALRTYLYTHPQETFDPEAIHMQYYGSAGHLRVRYKQCFGVRVHQDCITARVAMAKYQLATTAMSMRAVAEACGYADEKYFMRQFQAETGLTASQYRALTK